MKASKIPVLFHFLLLTSCFISCKQGEERLPILGEVQVHNGDTIYHKVMEMTLIDQDSNAFRLDQFPDKLVIGDFFFTSCPTICPRVQKQMLRIYDKYKDDNRVLLVSYSIDPRNDSTHVLKRYAENLGVNTEDWKFITGQKDSIFMLADSFFVSVVDDPSAPAGFDHSGRIILLDKARHIRGYAEGTDPESVTEFLGTIDKLLKEEYAP